MYTTSNKNPSREQIQYFVSNINPLKEDKQYVRITVGGDRIDYKGHPISTAVSILDTVIITNGVIHDTHKWERYGTVDISKFYLNNPMKND